MFSSVIAIVQPLLRSLIIVLLVSAPMIQSFSHFRRNGFVNSFRMQRNFRKLFPSSDRGMWSWNQQIMFSSNIDPLVSPAPASGFQFQNLLYKERYLVEKDDQTVGEDQYDRPFFQDDIIERGTDNGSRDRVSNRNEPESVMTSNDFAAMELQARQLALEEDVHDQAVQSYARISSQLQSMGRGTGQRHVKSHLLEWYDPFCRKIVEEINMIRQENKNRYVRLFLCT